MLAQLACYEIDVEDPETPMGVDKNMHGLQETRPQPSTLDKGGQNKHITAHTFSGRAKEEGNLSGRRLTPASPPHQITAGCLTS